MEFVKNTEGDFTLNGKIFRFIGCNMFELANLENSITEKMMSDAYNEGFKVIRFWAFEPMKKEKLKEICDIAAQYNVKIIPVLADKWGYLQSYKIDNEWYTDRYKKGYLSYITDIVKEFKDRKEILIWELLNEPETESFGMFYDFAKDVSERVKAADGNHLLSFGTIGGIGDKFGSEFSRFKISNFRKLYSLPSLDALSLHDYSYNSALFERLDMLNRFKGNLKTANLFMSISSFLDRPTDFIDKFCLNKFNKLVYLPLTLRYIWTWYNHRNIRIAKRLKKPLYIGEVGFKENRRLDRRKILELDIEKKFGDGIGGYILWSFESQGWSNDGHDYGFNLSDRFGEVVKKWNEKLNG
ncbi:MAG: cellulase family glycosylhydrolase [Ignavibacteria bacterium]